MTSEELREEIAIELENIETVLRELSILHEEAKGREASVLEKTAASAFLAQFYSGIENILKRISRYSNVPLPSGEIWHVELFRRFCDPPRHNQHLLSIFRLTQAQGERAWRRQAKRIQRRRMTSDASGVRWNEEEGGAA